MKNQEKKYITCTKIAWTIANFSSLKTNVPHYSDDFTAGHCSWKVAIYRGLQDGKFLGMFLYVANAKSLPNGWSIYTHLAFRVINQIFREKCVAKDMKYKFCANKQGRGFSSLIDLTVLQNPFHGYVLNDNCIVEVEFFEVKPERTQPISLPANSRDDVVNIDFKDLGRIDKTLVPMLEEVCSRHPSLMECKKKRSRMFTEWAFTSLGRVLQFLKDNKWEDMNEEACDHLQALWEELKMSKLDLSWLEPRVKRALDMKEYLENANKVKRLKQDLIVLESEVSKIKEHMANTEQCVEKTRQEFMNAESGLEETILNLDTEIGYGEFT